MNVLCLKGYSTDTYTTANHLFEYAKYDDLNKFCETAEKITNLDRTETRGEFRSFSSERIANHEIRARAE
jgi:hypothetical protein